jgi:hypothetical protein
MRQFFSQWLDRLEIFPALSPSYLWEAFYREKGFIA